MANWFTRLFRRSTTQATPFTSNSSMGTERGVQPNLTTPAFIKVRASPTSARIDGAATPAGTPVSFGDGVGFEMGIVGESNYMSALRKIAKRRKAPGEPVVFTARLIREPGNPFDENAVMVVGDDGEKLGYLSRGDAVDYGIALRVVESNGQVATCRAKLVGGTAEKKNFGVWLDIDAPEDVLARVMDPGVAAF